MSVSTLFSRLNNFDIHLLCIYTKLKYQIFFDNNGVHNVPKNENYIVFST